MKRILIFSAGILFLLSSCTYQDVEVIEVVDVQVKSFSANRIEAVIFVKIKNPNGYKIKIVDSDLDLYINNSKMGKAKLTKRVVIPAKSETIQEVGVEAKVGNLLSAGGIGGILSLIGSQSINLRVKGTIKAKAFVITKKVDVDFDKRVQL